MSSNILITWLYELMSSFATGAKWLQSSVVYFYGVSYTPLSLLTFVGLTGFISIAVIRWFI